MPPNTDDTATFGADPHNLSVGATASLEEDFHLIDDPPEHEGERSEIEAADDREQGTEPAAPQSAEKSVREGDETPETDIAERDKAARLRGAVDSAAGALRRGAAGIGKAAGAVGDGVAGSARAVGGRAKDVSAQAGRFASDSLRKVPVRRLHQPVTSAAASVGNALLATDVAVSLDQWMRTTFASGPATAYDKALDLTYNTLKQHGGDHRIFDGSHDLFGAWKTIAEAMPDEGWLQRAEGCVSALWKDMATPNGIPVVTWNKEAFDAVAELSQRDSGNIPNLGEGHGHLHGYRVHRRGPGGLGAGSELEQGRDPSILGNRREPGPVRTCRRESAPGHGHDCRAREVLSRGQTRRRIQADPERWRSWSGRNDGVARRLAPDAGTRVGDIDAGGGELSRGNPALRQGGAQG